MSRIFILLLVSVIFVVPNQCLGQAQKKVKQVTVDPKSVQYTENGRFSLFQGEYTSFDLKRKETNVLQAVFLLDTQTGEVKRYVNKIDEEGRYIETWLPTDLPLPDKKK